MKYCTSEYEAFRESSTGVVLLSAIPGSCSLRGHVEQKAKVSSKLWESYFPREAKTQTLPDSHLLSADSTKGHLYPTRRVIPLSETYRIKLASLALNVSSELPFFSKPWVL